MRLTDCIVTSNGLTCFYNNNNVFNKLSNLINNNNLVTRFNTKYFDYYTGYIILRLAEIVISDIVSNLKDIKNIENIENTCFIFN
tara:strand:+ start:342 stop:596 length:255 start_codon:yes stop_codon:yes gene_type:complete